MMEDKSQPGREAAGRALKNIEGKKEDAKLKN
jgi:hypothetical protein